MTAKTFAKLLDYHENAVRTLRAALALLSQANGRPTAATFADALRVDATRRAALGAANGRRSPKPSGRFTNAIRKKQRAKSAAYLAKFDKAEPRTLTGPGVKGMGSFVRRGYLAKKGDGYIRTAKPYIIDQFS